MSAQPEPSKPNRSLAGRRLGRYEVLTQLDAGGMAAVYVARAHGVAGFERFFALKVLHPNLAHEEEFVSMFLDEARLAARIRHPNVVATLDISDTEGDGYYLVMEYVEGDHIGGLIQRAARSGTRLPVPVISRIILDALAGLSAAHKLTDENGLSLELVHRDVSPHNILVSVDGIARLTDFGVAKAEVRLSSTRKGQFKGKLAYMAPEQASSGISDQRSDLFSMGIILWEALTGRRLFRGENNGETMDKVLKAPIPAPSSVRSDLAPWDGVLAKALERDPELRFQTADEFIDAIEEAALSFGGLASARQVTEAVKTYAKEKLDQEASRIRDAIDILGRSPSGGTLTSGSLASTLPSRPPPTTSGPMTIPPPSRIPGELDVELPPQAPAFRKYAIVAAILLLFGIGLAWAETFGDSEENRADRSPEQAPVTPAAAPAVEPDPREEEASAEAVEPSDPAPPRTERRTSRPATAAEPTPASPAEPEAAAPPPPPPVEEVMAKSEESERRPSGRRRASAPAPSAKEAPPSRPAPADDLLFNPYRR